MPKQSLRRWAGIVIHGNNYWKHEPYFRYQEHPKEIRELIIERIMYNLRVLPKTITVGQFNGPIPTARYPKFLPALCFASKQFFLDSVSVIIRHIEWVLTCTSANGALTFWLETLPEKAGFRCVRKLWFRNIYNFPGTHELPINLDMELMTRCHALTHLKLTFTDHSLTEAAPSNSKFLYKVKSVQEIVDFYDLEKIFLCEKLRVITFDGVLSPWNPFRDEQALCDGDPRARLRELATWIKDEYPQRLTQQKRQRRTVHIAPVVWRFNFCLR